MPTPRCNVPCEWLAAARIREGNNHRKDFNPRRLAETAASIDAAGLDNPIHVMRVPLDAEGHDLEIVSGHRRFRCMTALLGWAEVPGFIVEFDSAFAARKAMWIENQREPLNPIEEAVGLQEFIEAGHGGDLRALAAELNVSWDLLQRRLLLLELAPDLQEKVASGHIKIRFAEAIAGTDFSTRDPAERRERQWHAYRLHANRPDASLDWFRERLAEYANACGEAAQGGLFDGEFGATLTAPWTVPEEKDPPPLPGKEELPELTGTPQEVVRERARRYRAWAVAWHTRGIAKHETWFAARAEALEELLPTLPANGPGAVEAVHRVISKLTASLGSDAVIKALYEPAGAGV